MGSVKLAQRVGAAFRAFWGLNDERWRSYVLGPMTSAGTRVNEISSLSISSLFAALNFIAGIMATLPKVIYRQLPNGGKTRAFEHPLYDRLHNAPNDSGMTSWQWIYTSIMHKYLWGNWYTYIDAPSYQNQQFVPLLPDRTYVDPADPAVVISRVGTVSVRLPRSRILQIPHISLDGVTGRGLIYFARESLGLAKAQDEFAATYFGNGVHAGGFVEVPGDQVMTEETRRGLQQDFNDKYGGLGKSWKAIFLTGGAKFQAQEIDSEKAQALESRQYSVVEAARWTNLPPHILRDLSRATFGNIEQQGLELVIYSLLPLATQIEQAMNIAFFDAEERRTHFVKLELKGLLRGDLEARRKFYESMINLGIFNADMVLDLEDMNPQPDGLGQVYIAPLNMVNKQLIVSPQPLRLSERAGEAARATPAPPARRLVITERRTSAFRRKLTIAYRPKFQQFAEGVLAQELEAVRAAAKSMLGTRDAAAFRTWLATFYQEFGETVRALAAPLVAAYSEAILPAAADEVGSDANVAEAYAAFQKRYAEGVGHRHGGSSRAQLEAVVDEAADQADAATRVEARLVEWEEKRAGRIVELETVRAENAFTRQAFALLGVLKIRSVAYGDDCPYCHALDGKVIGIQESFLSAGDFKPDGANRPLSVSRNVSHPPYHEGCDCGIEAALG